jgi:hypothetical protein
MEKLSATRRWGDDYRSSRLRRPPSLLPVALALLAQAAFADDPKRFAAVQTWYGTITVTITGSGSGTGPDGAGGTITTTWSVKDSTTINFTQGNPGGLGSVALTWGGDNQTNISINDESHSRAREIGHVQSDRGGVG